jgi:hypothetical protein
MGSGDGKEPFERGEMSEKRRREAKELKFGGALYVFEGRQSVARQATPREVWEFAKDLGPIPGVPRGRHEKPEQGRRR